MCVIFVMSPLSLRKDVMKLMSRFLGPSSVAFIQIRKGGGKGWRQELQIWGGGFNSKKKKSTVWVVVCINIKKVTGFQEELVGLEPLHSLDVLACSRGPSHILPWTTGKMTKLVLYD